ncbi:FTR1 family iron permease [Bacillus massiliigorillae]|uniref:FTR1 family iron permease n=1 Tax=Bacillus massiliigorillae TaxID=1243664 RepID=UPI0003A207F3|nr:FTR1 family protein [Bacillus massiliigorillae]
MYRKIIYMCLSLLIILFSSVHLTAYAKDDVKESAKNLVTSLKDVQEQLQQNDIEAADQLFRDFKVEWTKVKGDIREDSPESLQMVESEMAQLSLSLLNEEKEKSIENCNELIEIMNKYSEGTLNTNPNKIEEKSLSSYITLLKDTKESLKKNDLATGKLQVQQLTNEWLSVEGDVVTQSQSVYNNAEKSLVLLAAYVEDESKISKAIKTIDTLIVDLEPLQKDSYGIWDAALIPIREGVEALLVVGALLTVVKKANVQKGRRWIWGGTLLGLLVSILIGVVVSYILTSISFGQNNFLINGWSGVLASLMLLYVSYWLHRNSNVKQWNSFIKDRTEMALSKGKMFSFAALAFLAILREGMETVIFLIGMVNRMPMEKLLLGIALGFSILIIIAILMLKVGAYLPLKPFFVVSSLIVFYMCIKFMGSGIHSLQLSGLIDSTVNESIPTISLLGVYPSWYSTIPQVAIFAIAIGVVIYKRVKQSRIEQKIGGTIS